MELKKSKGAHHSFRIEDKEVSIRQSQEIASKKKTELLTMKQVQAKVVEELSKE